MDIYTIREQYKNKNITDIPLRVVYYARVSTEKEEQLSALDNQLSYYNNYINSCHNWQFVKGYVDEGITGTSTKKREQFNQMISDAKQDKFDLVVVKEISRFARNTLDSIKYTRELLKMGVAVYFREDNINTLDTDSELRLAIMSSLAQDESRRISNRVKIGCKEAIKKGRVLGCSGIYGYTSNDGKLTINPKEAEMVKLIFELYATGQYGTKNICEILTEKGYVSHSGKDMDRTVINNIIKNPKYKGYYCGNKCKSTDMFTKSKRRLNSEEWTIWKDETGEIVPAIVLEEVWDKANKIMKDRGENVKNQRGKTNYRNLFTGKIQCGHCGSNYYIKYHTNPDGSKGNLCWCCGTKLKYRAANCDAFNIRETALVEIVKEIIILISKDYSNIVDTFIKLYTETCNDTNYDNKLNELNNRIEELKNKQDKLTDLVIDGTIDKQVYKSKNEKIVTEINELKEEVLKYSELKENNNADLTINSLKKLKETAEQLLSNKDINNETIITKEIVDLLIDKMIITSESDEKRKEKNAKVEVFLNIGDGTKYSYGIRKTNKGTNVFNLDYPMCLGSSVLNIVKIRNNVEHNIPTVINLYI